MINQKRTFSKNRRLRISSSFTNFQTRCFTAKRSYFRQVLRIRHDQMEFIY